MVTGANCRRAAWLAATRAGPVGYQGVPGAFAPRAGQWVLRRVQALVVFVLIVFVAVLSVVT